MTLREILQSKGNAVHTITSKNSLEDVVQTLVRFNCGSLVVCDEAPTEDACREPGRMIGIVTERDILRACAAKRAPLEQLLVADVMTTDVVTGLPGDSVEDTMGLMTAMRIRHLPVVEDGRLLGIVSIGDVVKIQHDTLSMENHYLKSYIQS